MSTALTPSRLSPAAGLRRAIVHLTPEEAENFLGALASGAKTAGAIASAVSPIGGIVNAATAVGGLAVKAVRGIRSAIRRRKRRRAAKARSGAAALRLGGRTGALPPRAVAPAGSAAVLLSGLIHSRALRDAIDALALGQTGGVVAAGRQRVPARALLTVLISLARQADREITGRGADPARRGNLDESLDAEDIRRLRARAPNYLALLRSEGSLWSSAIGGAP